MAVGYNNFDVDAMTARGVLGTNTPDVLTETTADFGFALLMATARRVTESEHFLRAGKWTKWRYDMFAGTDVHGTTLGILGMGRIGQGIARRGAHRLRHEGDLSQPLAPDARARGRVQGALRRARTSCCSSADHLVLVLPYSPASHHAIGAAELALMKPTATPDQHRARRHRRRRGAGAGAARAAASPPPASTCSRASRRCIPDLLDVPNVVLTPHIASATVPTRRAMADLAADNLIAALGRGPDAGRPPTPINRLPG